MVKKLIASAFHNDSHKLTLQYAEEKKRFEKSLQENKKASGEVPFKPEHGINHGGSFVDGFNVAILRNIVSGQTIQYAGNKFVVIGVIDDTFFGTSEGGSNPGVIDPASLVVGMTSMSGSIAPGSGNPVEGAIYPFSMDVNETTTGGVTTGTISNTPGIQIELPMPYWLMSDVKYTGGYVGGLRIVPRYHWDFMWIFANTEALWNSSIPNGGFGDPTNVVLIYRTDGK